MKAWLRITIMSALLAVATAAHAGGTVNNTTITNISLNSAYGDFVWIQTATAPTGGANVCGKYVEFHSLPGHGYR